jgi:hypothetical protein
MKQLQHLERRLIDMLNAGFNYKESTNILKMNRLAWDFNRIELDTYSVEGYVESNLITIPCETFDKEGIYRLYEVFSGDTMWLLYQDKKVSYIEGERVFDILFAIERDNKIKMILE